MTLRTRRQFLLLKSLPPSYPHTTQSDEAPRAHHRNFRTPPCEVIDALPPPTMPRHLHKGGCKLRIDLFQSILQGDGTKFGRSAIIAHCLGKSTSTGASTVARNRSTAECLILHVSCDCGRCLTVRHRVVLPGLGDILERHLDVRYRYWCLKTKARSSYKII